MLLILIFISVFNCYLGRDICTQYGVLRQIDSFLVSQKESKQAIFDISALQKINKKVSSNYNNFETNLKQYLESDNPNENETDMIKFNDNKNFIKITGTLENIAKECEKIGASLFTPSTLKESEQAAALIKKLNILKIPINVRPNRGYLVTSDGSSLSPAITKDTEILKSWTHTFPLLMADTISTGTPNLDVTAFCETVNNPWDRPGPNKDKWLELGKLLLKTTPTLLSTVNKISANFGSKSSITKVPSATAPEATQYPIPQSFINIADTFSKWSSPSEWEKTQLSDLDSFKNLISDIGKVSSLFTEKKTINKFAKKPTPALGFQIDPHALPSSLDIDPNSILLDNSMFYPQKFLDTSGDAIPELVSGPLVIKHAEKTDKIEIYELLPLLFGDYRLESVSLIRGSSFRDLAFLTPPSGIRCSEREGSKICDGYSKKLIPASGTVDPKACMDALLGLDASVNGIRKCPMSSTLNTEAIGFRIDCSDNFNIVIDSKKPLFITPVCDSQDGEGFKAEHFPLYLNTDCGIRAKYLEKDSPFLLSIPQVEADAEGGDDESATDMTLITPFVNTILSLPSEPSLFDNIASLPNMSINIIVSIVSIVFGTTLFIFAGLLFFCIGPKKVTKFLIERCSCCSCCSCDRSKFDCSKLNCKEYCKNNKCKKENKKKATNKKPKKRKCPCCCQADSDSESGLRSAGRTPGPSRTPARHSMRGSVNSDLDRIGAQILNMVQGRSPSAPFENEIELTPLNKNINQSR